MKKNEIRPANLLEEFLRLSALDAEAYFRPNNRVVIPCPACDCMDHGPEGFNKWGFQYIQCKNCFTLYLSPRPLLSDFKKFYTASPSAKYWANTFYPQVAEVRREKIVRPNVERISSICQHKEVSTDLIIDVGAGYGLFLEEWGKKDCQARLQAIEPLPDLAKMCREKGFETLETILETTKIWQETADLVTCFEVIEHAHDPLKFVRSLYNLAKNGGWVILTGLGVDGFDIQILWDKSESILPPQHINFMSMRGFEILFQRAGFSEVEILTPGRLDVDIVVNATQEDPEFNIGRFEKILLKRGQKTLKEFQRFLAENQLSSHVWMVAHKKH